MKISHSLLIRLANSVQNINEILTQKEMRPLYSVLSTEYRG
jgi:hypothetical protein